MAEKTPIGVNSIGVF